ncbi:MAG: hypothetical protein KAJ33_07495 [Thermoplasmata archaeon]|nr:hypothetical protein [Thermoplasmata archaeon]MCK5398075.1 hypothetical protein [Thermoplasmata archaeon]
MVYVLDATAIRSGMTIAGEGWYTTQDIVDEVKLGRQARNLDMLLGVSIKVMSPDEASVNIIKETASKTHDIESLSRTDIGVLALAYELQATIISDDYAVQNIARILKIPIKTDLKGIREIIHWTFRCRGCGRYFEKEPVDCPICGSEIRKVKKK